MSPKLPLQWLRRRVLRFSLRTMLVLLTIVSIWLGTSVNNVVNTRRALAFVAELNGKVYFRHQPNAQERIRINRENRSRRFTGLPLLPMDREPGPKWLRNVLGDDYFRLVSEVQLSGTTIADEDLPRLEYLKDLRVLALAQTEIGDDGLAALPPFPQMHALRLQGTKVTDKGLRHLASRASLKHVDLSGSGVTAEGIEELQRQRPDLKIAHSR